jgi:hypothetical protein
MFAVSDAAALVSDGIDPLLDQAVGDLRILGEPSTDALVSGGHAAGLLAEQDASREAGFPPRSIRIVARDSHGSFNVPGIADDFNPSPQISGTIFRAPGQPILPDRTSGAFEFSRSLSEQGEESCDWGILGWGQGGERRGGDPSEPSISMTEA